MVLLVVFYFMLLLVVRFVLSGVGCSGGNFNVVMMELVRGF